VLAWGTTIQCGRDRIEKCERHLAALGVGAGGGMLPSPPALRRTARAPLKGDGGTRTDAKEVFYQLNEVKGFHPRNRHLGPGTGLDWAARQLSAKNAPKLTRATRPRA